MNDGRIFFINTFEPVVPIYRDVFASLGKAGGRPVAIVSACQYRAGKKASGSFDQIVLWVPRLLRKNRRWCALFYSMLMALRLLTLPANSSIVFLSQPPLFYIAGALIARARGLRYYLHVMDLYPELLARLGVFGQGKIRRWLDSSAKKAFLHAEMIIVPGRCMKSILIQKGVSAEKIEIVENWPENNLAPDREAGREFRKAHGLADRFVVMYCGNMGRFHNFSTILSVARSMRGSQDVVFVFIGTGVRRVEVEMAVAEGLDNILLLDHQPLNKFNGMLNAADVHFVCLGKGYEGLMVPSKFYSVLAVGKPTIYEGIYRAKSAR